MEHGRERKTAFQYEQAVFHSHDCFREGILDKAYAGTGSFESLFYSQAGLWMAPISLSGGECARASFSVFLRCLDSNDEDGCLIVQVLVILVWT